MALALRNGPVRQAGSRVETSREPTGTVPRTREHPVVHLQRLIGNRAVERLLASSSQQPAPTGVGELAARTLRNTAGNRALARVLQNCGGSAARLQRKCACGGGVAITSAKPASASSGEGECEECRSERLGREHAAAATVHRKIGDGHDLTAPRFIEPARDEDLEACYDDEARLTLGDMGQPGTRKVNSGAAVKRVQAALIDLGLLAPGEDTGTYTRETWNAVKVLKKANSLGWENMGDVGPGTMDWLDKHFTPVQPVCPPCPEDPRTPGCPACPPSPKPAPQPRANCSDDEAGKIASALSGAIGDLNSALGMLDRSSPLRDDALWLAFRTTGEGDIPAIKKVLTAVQAGLPSAKIECSDPGILICNDPRTDAQTNTLTGTIFICRSHFPELGARTLIHEGCHAFAGLTGLGELYFDDNCGEGDVVGQSRAFRLQNADSFACFVHLLTHSAETNLAARVRHSKGEDLALRQKPPGDVSLAGPEGTPTFSLVGFSDVGVKGIRWILKDDAGRRYLLRKGAEIIAPDEEVDWVSDITIGAKTRALLRERGVSQVELSAVSRIPEVGQKAVELRIKLTP